MAQLVDADNNQYESNDASNNGVNDGTDAPPDRRTRVDG
jgi:hypothetical protein